MRTNLLLLATLAALATNTLSAQNATYRNDLSLSVGPNIFMLARAFDFEQTGDGTLLYGSADGYGTPTFQIAYDRSITKWFSLGAAYGFNQCGMRFDDLQYTSNGETQTLGDISVAFKRHSINVRPLFHYANNGRIDLYSGLRLGAAVWRINPSINLDDDQLDAIKRLSKWLDRIGGGAVLPQAALTVFGLRAHVTENLGLGFEFNVGSPYIASASVDYRF